MNFSDDITTPLKNNTYTWCITGVAGFIGSHLLENLLLLNQKVVGIDNFSTGYQKNLDLVKEIVGDELWSNFTFHESDIRDYEACLKLTKEVDIVLHQAALGSVPRSVKDPLSSHANNINGQLNIIWAAHLNKVKKIVFASSSSVYGDEEKLPKVEDVVGNPLSPYAVTKKVNELYALTFHKVYNLPIIGLRYFNVFGARQDPQGAYAAVIPRWAKEILTGEQVSIFGDGETSRDFCYIKNVVQANLLAGLTESEDAIGEIYNVAVADRTTLTQLFDLLMSSLKEKQSDIKTQTPVYKDFREGDIRHSFAEIKKIQTKLNYKPTHMLGEGLNECVDWYIENVRDSRTT